MGSLPHGDFESEAVERLADLVDQSLDDTVHYEHDAARSTDAFLIAGDTAFMLDCRTATYTAALHHAIRSLKARVSDAPGRRCRETDRASAGGAVHGSCRQEPVQRRGLQLAGPIRQRKHPRTGAFGSARGQRQPFQTPRAACIRVRPGGVSRRATLADLSEGPLLTASPSADGRHGRGLREPRRPQSCGSRSRSPAGQGGPGARRRSAATCLALGV